MPLAARDIQEIYLAYFGRPADPTGLAYWQGKTDLTEAANAFAQSAEYQSLYAANDYAQLVTNIYQNLFKRVPEETGLKYWVQQLNDGKVQPGQAALTILSSALGQDAAVLKAKLDTAESFTAALSTDTLAAAYKGAGPAADARANWAAITSEATAATIKANFPALIDKMQTHWVDGVQKVYVAYLGRPADSAGLNYWVERAIATKGDWNSIAEGFASSAESQKLYGGSSNAALVNAIYLNVLGRAAEPVGSQYWVDQLAKGTTTPGALALMLANSTLGKDTITLNQRIDGAKAFTLQLETAGRNDDFTGATVTSVAREWLYGIGPDQNDYDAALAAIPYLVSAFVKGQVQGLLVNGYISGATVFIDADGDGVLDAGEVSVKSDAAGNFLFPEGTEKGTVVAFGGTNISTGQANTTTLKAPVGATVVTPLTNLVQKMIDSGLADGIDAAENLLFGALGMPKVDLSAFDPLKTALNGSAAEKAIAVQIEAATVQIANTLATGSALLQGAGLTLAQAQAAMLGALTQTISGGTSVNLGQASTLQTVLQQAVSDSGLTSAQQTQANNAIGATSQVLGEINTRTEQAADAFSAGTITNPVSALSDMFKLATLVQTEVSGAVQQGTSSGSTTQLTTDYTGTGLTQNVDQVQGGQINPGTPTDDGTTVTNGGGGGGGGGGANENVAPVLTAPDPIDFTDTAADDTFTNATGTLSATDANTGDTITYGIKDGTDSQDGLSVSMKGTYGTLVVVKASGAYTFTPNDEAIEALKGKELLSMVPGLKSIQGIPTPSNKSETFTVTATDGKVTTPASQTLTINVTGANDTAVITGDTTGKVTKDMDEDLTTVGVQTVANGTLIQTVANGTLSVSDRDAGDNVFRATTSAQNSDYGSYTVTTTGEWVYTLDNANTTVQALTATSDALTDTFTVRSADFTEQVVTVTIHGAAAVVVSDTTAPVFSSGNSASVNENQNVLYTAAAADSSADGGPSNPVTYTLASGGDASFLSINGSTGEVTLASGNLDFESAKTSYSFSVVATDAANNAETKAVTVSVTNLDDTAPEFNSATSGSADENHNVLYTASATDSDADTVHGSGTVTYTLASGGDASFLSINGSTGAVTLASGNLDFESGKTSYSFSVVATDEASNAKTQAVTISVTNIAENDVNDVLVGTSGPDTINGLSGDDTITGGAGADDLTGGAGDDTFIYALGDATVSSFSGTSESDPKAPNTGDTFTGTEVIRDLAIGDVLRTGNTSLIADATGDGFGSLNDNEYMLVAGSYGSGGVFTVGTGTDTLLIYDADSTTGFEQAAIVLVGVDKTTEAGSIVNTAGVLTFAAPAVTFAVTAGDSGAYTVGIENGDVVVTDDSTNFVFTPTVGTAVNVLKTDLSGALTVGGGIKLTGAAAVLTQLIGGITGAVTLSDTVSVAVADLIAIGGKTSGDVTVANAVAISGTAAEVTAALVTPNTKVIAATAKVTINDAIDTLDVTDLTNIYDSTSGTVTINGTGANETWDLKASINRNLVINGLGGDDTITSGSGNGNDTINGGDGNDTITSGNGNDIINGGDGNDKITSGSGNDTINGGDGDDTITGGAGTNTITGDAGKDTITGGTGDDTITGGTGDDIITLAGGSDLVVFEATALDNGLDTITGFNAGLLALGGDVLKVSAFLGAIPSLPAGIVTDSATDNKSVAPGNILRVTDAGTELDATGIAALFGGGGKPFGTINSSDKYVLITNAGKVWFIDTALDTDAATLTASDIVLVGTIGTVDLSALVADNFA